MLIISPNSLGAVFIQSIAAATLSWLVLTARNADNSRTRLKILNILSDIRTANNGAYLLDCHVADRMVDTVKLSRR